MNYYKFTYSESNCLILRKRATYTRSAVSRAWPKVPQTMKPETYASAKNYQNFVTSIPFFNNFGGKAYCRASWSYTYDGYLPTEITTVSPDGLTKHVDRFEFVPCSLYFAKQYAGNRERDVIDHCEAVTIHRDGAHQLFTFQHRDGEHTATWDNSARRWVG